MQHRIASLALSMFVASATVSPSRAQWKVTQLIPNAPQQIDLPTCMAVAPDGRIFFNELYAARIRIFDTKTEKLLVKPFAVVPNTWAKDERGLLGIALHPEFPKQPFVYVVHYENRNGTPVGRILRFTANGNVGSNMTTIVDNMPTARTHLGGVLRFGPDGKLYYPIGDVLVPGNSQDTSVLNPAGKIHRINADGTIPKDNPFGSRNSQFCLGIRNCFGMAFHPVTGDLFMADNGPIGNDEMNLVRPKGNLGWPAELGNQGKPGYDKPLITWKVTTAPCGMAFTRAKTYPITLLHSVWTCDFSGHGIRVGILGGNPANQYLTERFIPGITKPVDIVQAPNGKMYVLSYGKHTLYRIDWTGPAPVLPDLAINGTPTVNDDVLVTQRGDAGSGMLVFIGTRVDPPVSTIFGMAEVWALAVKFGGFAGPDGIITVRARVPNIATLRGISVHLQSLELKLPAATLHFTNRAVLAIR